MGPETRRKTKLVRAFRLGETHGTREFRNWFDHRWESHRIRLSVAVASADEMDSKHLGLISTFATIGHPPSALHLGPLPGREMARLNVADTHIEGEMT